MVGGVFNHPFHIATAHQFRDHKGLALLLTQVEAVFNNRSRSSGAYSSIHRSRGHASENLVVLFYRGADSDGGPLSKGIFSIFV